MKTILDACCGSRMFWFDRQNPDVVFMDRREESWCSSGARIRFQRRKC